MAWTSLRCPQLPPAIFDGVLPLWRHLESTNPPIEELVHKAMGEQLAPTKWAKKK